MLEEILKKIDLIKHINAMRHPNLRDLTTLITIVLNDRGYSAVRSAQDFHRVEDCTRCGKRTLFNCVYTVDRKQLQAFRVLER